MTKFETIINLCGSAVVTFFCLLFGGWDMWIKVLLGVIIVDYITGVMSAWERGTLSSRIGAKGICKKIMILAIVALACWLDQLLGATGALRAMAIGFYIANDSLSIIENAAAMGLNVPKGLVDKLEQLKEQNDSGQK